MDTPVQDILNDIDNQQVNYSTFWQRFFAIIIDSLILAPLILVETYNKTTWKSLPVFFISFLIALAYKPVLESIFRATVGKMALGLTIVSSENKPAAVKHIVLRNIFDIADRLIIAVVTLITFLNPAFQDAESLAAYSRLSNSVANATWISYGLTLVGLIDAIFLIADKRRQSLHDKIANTFVIQKTKS